MPKSRKQRKVSKNVRRYVRNQLSKSSMTNIFHLSDVENSIVSTTAGTVFEVSKVGSADNMVGREGNEIRGFGLYLNYILLSSGLTVTIPQYVRVIVYNANDGEFTAGTDEFLQNPSQMEPATLTASLITDIIQQMNTRQLKVLYDRTHKLEGQAEGQGSSSVKVKKLLKFNHKRIFETETGTIDSKTNNLRMLVLNREIDNDANAVTCEFSLFSKYYFKDMKS